MKAGVEDYSINPLVQEEEYINGPHQIKVSFVMSYSDWCKFVDLQCWNEVCQFLTERERIDTLM